MVLLHYDIDIIITSYVAKKYDDALNENFIFMFVLLICTCLGCKTISGVCHYVLCYFLIMSIDYYRLKAVLASPSFSSRPM